MDLSIALIFFVVALLYASVGHGGASGYLALMALFGSLPEVMRPTALLLNIVVSAVAFVFYRRAGYFRWSLFWPFAITSVPFAWLAAGHDLPPSIYRSVLGILLLFAVIRMIWNGQAVNRATKEMTLAASMLIGAMLGTIAGLIGIGGGILLSPLLVLLGWADVKTTAATSALFIWVNSMAGMGGLFASDQLELYKEWPMLLLAVLTGGLLGGWLGSSPMKSGQVRGVLAVVLLLASVKLIFLS